jgi:MFS family permease
VDTGLAAQAPSRSFPPFPYALVAGGFAISFVLVGGGINTVGVFLNAISEAMHWSRSALSIAVSFGAIVAALATPLVGVAVDRFGVRVPIAAGVLLLGVGYAITATMQSPWHFVVANLFLGAGFASCSLFPITIAIGVLGGERTALALGLAAAGSSLGSLVLLPAVQAMIDAVTWRGAYVAMGAAIVAAPLPLLAFVLPRGPLERADPLGATGLALGELRRPGVDALALLMIVPGLVTFAVSVHVVPFLTGHGLSAGNAALTLGAAVGLSIVGKLLGGVVADRIGALQTLRAALAVGAAALVVLATSHSVAGLAVFAALYGLYLGTQVAAVPALALQVLGAARFGSLFGALQLGAMLAAAAGPVVAGAMFDLTGRYDEVVAFWIAALLAALAVAVWMPAPRDGLAGEAAP